jgi:hypothetical protein
MSGSSSPGQQAASVVCSLTSKGSFKVSSPVNIQNPLYASPPGRSPVPSGNGMLVDMERVKMPLPDGPPPQTPLTKRAKLSGQIAAQMDRQQQGQQSVSQLGSVPMSDPPDLLQSLSPVLSPITGIGFSQLSSIPDTPSPLRQATMGTIDTVISSQSDYETNTIIQDPDVDEVVSPFVFENPDVTLALFRHVACVEGHRASLMKPKRLKSMHA